MSAMTRTNARSPSQPTSFSQGLVDALPMLRAFARSLCGNKTQADDLVQETILRALSNSDKYEPGTNLDAWLVTILRNHFYSLGRKRRREVEDVDGAMAGRLVDAPRQDGQMAMSEFVRALAQLPDEQREALILVGASGFSYEEAAEICRVRVGTIKSRVSRARSRLESILAPSSNENTGLAGERPGAAGTLR
jgi:RNA polymerase sigma-70 factor (ECF subfamily)